jgi:hypothetical protein
MARCVELADDDGDVKASIRDVYEDAADLHERVLAAVPNPDAAPGEVRYPPRLPGRRLGSGSESGDDGDGVGPVRQPR